jgi:hypothetical protein
MKKGIWIGGSIVVALILMGASFYGGTLYQKNAQSRIQANFLESRGLTGGFNGGNFNRAGGTPDANRAGFGGGALGQVKSINGNTLTLSTAQNETSVTLSGTTVIMKSDPGTLADIKVGDRVQVTGQRDSSGNITASEIMILAPAGNPGVGGNGGPARAVTPTP